MTPSYYMPTALDEALALLARGGARVVAGGTDFFPSQGRTPVTHDLIDLTRIEQLRGITRDQDGGWQIGATTRWSDILAAELPPVFDGLKAAAREVGSVQIQNAGTVAGNLCNASPAADGVPPLLTLQADVVLQGPGGARRVPLDRFLTGVRRTALHPGEIVVALDIPAQDPTARSAFSKLGARRYLVISIAMTAVVLCCDDAGRIKTVRISVGSCSAVAQRLRTLESDLIGQTLDEFEVTPGHLAPLSPISDVRADADYRRDAVAEQVLRTLRAATDG